MGAVDLGGGGKSHKKGSGVKQPKRVGFKLDMTPLVDIAFLLLTFFMFATTMSQPQIMEMRVPPNDTQDVQVRAEDLWTIAIASDEKLYQKVGTGEFAPLTMTDLRTEAVQRNATAKDHNDLITVVKVANTAKFQKLVAVLDVLNTAEAQLKQMYVEKGWGERKRKFSLMPMDSATTEEIKSL